MLLVSAILVGLGAALTIAGKYGHPRLVYIFKPLATLLIIAVTLYPAAEVAETYRNLIFAGLLFSLAGDVFLMLPSDRFLWGLGNFLVAHFLYVFAFAGQFEWVVVWPLLALCLGVVGLAAGIAWPRVGKLLPAVLLYIAAIAGMFWQAGSWWWTTGDTAALLAFAGAGFFVVSDGLLGFNRFVKPFASAEFLLLSTYYTAQWLIAVSVVV